MDDARGGGEIQPSGQLYCYSDRVINRRGTTIAHHHVQRLSGDEILSEISRQVENPRGERRRNGGMGQIGRDQLIQRGGEPMHAVGGDVESEQFDRDEAVLFRFIGSKNRAQGSCANLM